MIALRNTGLLGLLLAAGAAQARVPNVVASIAPVHSLVAAVMQGVGEPVLLVPANVSDHDYALKPSDLRKIEGADLVVWIGEPLETYLVKPLATEGVVNLELIGIEGADPHPYASAGTDAELADTHEETTAEVHEHEEEHGRDRLGLDPHIWLDPVRAASIVEAAGNRLAELDPEHADSYRQNAARTVADLKKLDASIGQRLAPLATKPFVTFHDGYSYFVERYGLNQVGELTVHPEQRPGAASVRALRDMIAAKGVACAFAEPQFDPATLQVLAGDTRMKIGTLDAIGANLPPGADLYPSLLQQNARAIESCLSSTS
jgi:zinc transport system substrate-binding protein